MQQKLCIKGTDHQTGYKFQTVCPARKNVRARKTQAATGQTLNPKGRASKIIQMMMYAF